LFAHENSIISTAVKPELLKEKISPKCSSIENIIRFDFATKIALALNDINQGVDGLNLQTVKLAPIFFKLDPCLHMKHSISTIVKLEVTIKMVGCSSINTKSTKALVFISFQAMKIVLILLLQFFACLHMKFGNIEAVGSRLKVIVIN